jgi:hypothetical protein
MTGFRGSLLWLTAWSKYILEEQVVIQLIKHSPGKLISAFVAHHRFISSRRINLRSILISSSYFLLSVLSRGRFPYGLRIIIFWLKSCMHFSMPPYLYVLSSDYNFVWISQYSIVLHVLTHFSLCFPYKTTCILIFWFPDRRWENKRL